MSETTMYYECSADGCTTDTPKPCGSRCHARLVQPSTEPITEDTPTPPDAEAVERETQAYLRVLSRMDSPVEADDRLYLDAYREAVERRVRAEYAERIRNLTTMLEEEAYHRMAAESRVEPDSGNVRIEVTDSAEVEWMRELLADFYAEDVEALRLHPDIPWGVGGKSGAEHVAEWRNDLANRIERILAANRAAQDHPNGGPDDGQ